MSTREKAEAAWGALPDWVAALADAADRTSQAQVARLLGVNSGYISYALRNQKPEYHHSVEDAARGKLMSEMLVCPVLGEIGKSQCVRLRKRKVNPLLAEERQLRAACATCIHNTSRKEADHAAE